MDAGKIAATLIALAEGDESAANGLSAKERQVMEEQFPPLEAVRAYLQGIRD